MAEIKNIVVPLDDASPAGLVLIAANHLGIDPDKIAHVNVLRRALDARGRRAPQWVMNLDVVLIGDTPAPAEPAPVHAPRTASSNRCPPIIIGMGPAGLFAALRFADAGVPCIVLERGAALRDRHKRAKGLRADGRLDPECNLCFGEGGAGAYSDGKLYTRKKSPEVRYVYERLVEFGADPDILVDAHPHIGTNRLIPLLNRIHDYLADRSVDMRFDARMDDLVVDDGRLKALVVGGQEVATDHAILATGHSARDTYAMLSRHNVSMVPKAFAVGARVEHPQSLINAMQFGRYAEHPALGSAEYFLRCQRNGRGVYSFCMCPGGFIIPTPTEPEHLNVNGMSNQSRKNHFGNAALVVTIEPSDFSPTSDPLAGLEFQRKIERLAYEVGGADYNAPATRLTDFVRERGSTNLPARTSYRPGLTPADISDVLPPLITAALRDAIHTFDRRLRGYLTEEAVIVAAETTTSSPIRIVRDDDLQSPTVAGLYPTGEGAGYSGGIVSSAIDGMKVADRILTGL